MHFHILISRYNQRTCSQEFLNLAVLEILENLQEEIKIEIHFS